MNTPTAATVTIEGMSCASCAVRAEQALTSIDGVEAFVNAATGTARLRGQFDAEQVEAALSKTSYRARVRQLKLSLNKVVPEATQAIARLPGVVGVSSSGKHFAVDTLWTPASDIVSTLAGLGIRAEVAENTSGGESGVSSNTVLVSAALTLPVFVAEMGGHAIPALHHALMQFPGQTGLWAMEFLLTALVLLGPGRVLVVTGFRALLAGAPEMNSLVAIGASAAFGFSAISLFAPSLFPDGSAAVYFEAACVIVTLILLGRWLEDRAKLRANAEASALAAMQPKTAFLERDGDVVEISSDAVLPGDILRVRPGGRIPVDGIVLDGESQVDSSMMTGEPLPVPVGPEDSLIGGTVNGQGALRMRVTATGSDTTLARIVGKVEEARASRMPVEALVNRVTSVFVPVVILIAFCTLIGWLIAGESLGQGVYTAVSVLIIACPCAMGLATPTSIAIATGRAARDGILLKDGAAFQQLARARTIAFDKTGTLTEGRPQIIDLVVIGMEEDAAISIAAGVEQEMDHPVARSIVALAEDRGLKHSNVSDVVDIPGYGAMARLQGKQVLIGAGRLMDREGVDVETAASFIETARSKGRPVFFLSLDGELIGAFAVADAIKPGAGEAMAGLPDFRTVLLSGDDSKAVAAVADALKIDEAIGDLLPEDKIRRMEGLVRPLAFVGDGTNDAPALAAADVGIAIGTGTDVAIEEADVVLTGGDPRLVVRAVEMSRAVMRNISQNLFWAFAYNVILIPVAIAGYLRPELAAGAMAASSLLVVGNALRLRWV